MSGSIQNGNLTSVHQVTKHKHPHFKDNVRSQYLLQIKIYITLSFRWHVQIVFTHKQMHLSHQDCYNPLLVRQCSLWSCFTAGLFSGCHCVLSKRIMKSFVKRSLILVGWGFPLSAFPTIFLPLEGWLRMPKHCSIPF